MSRAIAPSAPRMATAAAAAAAALALGACGERVEPTTSSAQPQSVTVVLAGKPTAVDTCLFEAQASGAFQAAGLKVQLLVPRSAAAPLEMLGNGRATFAETTPEAILDERAGGAPFVSVALLTTTPVDAVAMPAKSVKGAKGKPKRVAGSPSPLVLATTEATAKAHGNVVRRFVQAAGRACAAGPKSLTAGVEALKAAAKAHPRAPAMAAPTGPPTIVPYGTSPWGWQAPAAWQRLDARMRAHGMAASAPSVGTAYTNEFLAGEGV